MAQSTKWTPVDANRLTPQQLAVYRQLFRRGRVGHFLHPGQMRIWEAIEKSPSDVQVLCVSRQWGKSHFCVTMAIQYAIQHPGSYVHYCAPFIKQVQNIVAPKMRQLLHLLPSEDHPHKSGDKWLFPNGSTIEVVGIEVGSGNRLRGVTSNLVVIDECRDINNLEDLIESVIEPLFSTTDGKLILVSTPPDTPGHAFTAKYITEALQGGYFYHGTYKENPVQTERQLQKRFEKEQVEDGSDRFKREYLADWTVVDSNLKVVTGYDEKANDEWLAQWTPQEKMRPYVGVDIGARDHTAIVFGLYDWFEATLVILDEVLLTNPTTRDIARAITEKEQLWFKSHVDAGIDPRRICDVDLRFAADLVKEYGLKIYPVRKEKQDAMLNQLNSRLEVLQIVVHPRCIMLRQQMKVGVFNDRHTDYQRTDDLGHLDAIDALKYLNLTVDWRETFGAPKLQASQQAPKSPDQAQRITTPLAQPMTAETLFSALQRGRPLRPGLR